MVEPNEAMRELKEELQQEQWQQFWKRFGNYFVMASVAIVLATIGIQLWKNHRHTQAEKTTAIILQAATAAEGGSFEKAEALLTPLPGGGDAEALGGLIKAKSLAGMGKLSEAAEAYLAIADDKGVDSGLRDFARIRAHILLLDAGMPTKANIEEAAKPGRPFEYTAREMLALTLLREGKQDEAIEIYSALSGSDETPPGIRQRASDMLSAYSAPPAAKE